MEDKSTEIVFSGFEEEARGFLKTISGYYVYALCRTNGEPFYIGKGKGNRALQHVSEARQGKRLYEQNPHKNNIIRKIRASGGRITYKIFEIYTDEQECLNSETRLIELFGRVCDGGCLANLAAGYGSARGPAPLSKKRHDDTLSGTPDSNPNRAKLNNYLQSIGRVDSVPIKPLNQIKLRHSQAHTQPRSPSLRCAYALIASAAASNCVLQTDVVIPRTFSFDGVFGVIENGVCRDILKAEMASLEPADDPKMEGFRLNEKQIGLLENLYGVGRLEKFGITR